MPEFGRQSLMSGLKLPVPGKPGTPGIPGDRATGRRGVAGTMP